MPDFAQGIDVSHHQGGVNWNAVAASGISFTFIKATEGAHMTDAAFATYWNGARAAGIRRGAYHFFRPADSGIQQADFFLRTVGAFAEGDLPPILDWEVTDNVSNAVDVSEVQEARPPGFDQEGRSYFARASFSDPDGNRWVLQEITTRLPGREWED